MYEARGKKKAAIAFLKDVGVHRPVINTQIPYNWRRFNTTAEHRELNVVLKEVKRGKGKTTRVAKISRNY